MTIEQLTDMIVDIAQQLVNLASVGRFYNQAVWLDVMTAASSAAKEIYGDSLPAEARWVIADTLTRGQPLGASGTFFVDGDGVVTKP